MSRALPARKPARPTPTRIALVTLLLASQGLSSAWAVGMPSTYPGCATRTASVAKGGSVTVNLSDCHSFGLGGVARAPVQGTATPGNGAPINSYVYTHGGGAVAAGASDSFVVLDDNSDFITVRVALQGGTSALVGAPATLPPMRAGSGYEQVLSASGGLAPYAYRIASGRLPAGLSLEATGRLSGTPSARGPFNFTVRVTDARGDSADKAYAGSIAPGTLSLAPSRVAAVQGQAFSQALTATGGVAPYRFLLEANAPLPTGLRLSPTGALTAGADLPAGTYALTVRVTDSSTGTGDYFQLRPLTLEVSGGTVPTVSIAVSPAAVAEDDGVALVYTVTRSLRLDTPTVVNITASGTAKTRVRRTVVIPAGALSATVPIYPIADAVAEPDETVVLSIAAGAGYILGNTPSASATLVNDDLP